MPKPDDFSEVTIEDDDGYRGSETLGIKEIVLERYRTCCVECAKEMSAGGIQKRFIKGIGYISVYVPNQREVFINSVEALQIILQPYVEDKKMNTEVAEVENRIINLVYSFKGRKKHFGVYENKGAAINWERIDNEYEPQFVELYKEKLMIFSKLLKVMNYMGEASAMG